MEATPLSLPFEAIDDLIYSARAGDNEALREDITRLSQENNCSPGKIIESAIDAEDDNAGGTGACLLHFPAANANIEILKYLLESLDSDSSLTGDSSTSAADRRRLINHRNNSGNTPLHWAALNTHLDCVKALVEAGADVRAKNNAGHEAAFLAERSEWSRLGDDEASASAESNEGDQSSDEPGSVRPMSVGMQVVRFLLLESDIPNGTEQHETELDADAGAERVDGDDAMNGDSTT